MERHPPRQKHHITTYYVHNTLYYSRSPHLLVFSALRFHKPDDARTLYSLSVLLSISCKRELKFGLCSTFTIGEKCGEFREKCYIKRLKN